MSEYKKMTDFGVRYLAKDVTVPNDTWKTGLNNHDAVIGPSGAGKTTGYVLPNLMSTNSSMIVADSKGSLSRKYSETLKRKGFNVFTLDFIIPANSCKYNPLEYISRDENGGYSDLDIKTLVNFIVPAPGKDEQFWVTSAKTVLETLVAFALEALPEEEHTLSSVVDLYRVMIQQTASSSNPNVKTTIAFLDEFSVRNPDSLTAQKYPMFKGVLNTDRTWNCITQFVTNALDKFAVSEVKGMLNGNDFMIQDIGKTPTILFLNISDNDSSLYGLVNIFYSQCMNLLIKEADKNPDNRLTVPVRFILDDFAAIAYIPEFDRIISTIRSREISVSIILQSLSQLYSRYG